MSDRTFVDTNVLVYAVDESEPAKREIARRTLADEENGELVLSSQVLSEFYVTVTRKLATPLTAEQAAQSVNRLAATNLAIAIDSAHVEQAITTSRSCQISYWDGLIVAAASRSGCSRLLSEDLNDGQRFGCVLVENPFRDA
jgi:predicted nucleic acid-binding protein